jgi:hypothetical protein
MRNRKQIVLESMDSMLASAQIEAQPGITLEKFLLELEFLVEYPKAGEAGKFSAGQIKYIKSVLDGAYEVREFAGIKYYVGQGLMI